MNNTLELFCFNDQKYSKVNSVGGWCKNVAKKALALGVPYVTFTTATWGVEDGAFK